MTTGEPLAPPELEPPLVLVLEVLAALGALPLLAELLLEPPHPPVRSAAIAAIAAPDNIQALRLDLVI